MTQYLIRRTLAALLTLAIVAVITFFLLRLAPGGPFDSDHAWPAEIQAHIEAHYGLDQPLLTQFLRWAGDVAHGNLRESFQYIGRPVTEMISETFPTSAALGLWSLTFALVLGVPMGCIAAWKRGTWLDHSAMFLAIAGVSLPSYLVASLLVLVFSLQLGWLPSALWEGPSSMILPVITLGLRPLALIARLTRAAMLESLQSDYVRTALAKGATTASIVFRHALRNSLIPVITLLGPLAAQLLTGSFVVETVFEIPGMGKYFVQAVLNRDYPLVMGVTLFFGLLLVASNLLSDLLLAAADPRIEVIE